MRWDEWMIGWMNSQIILDERDRREGERGWDVVER